MLPEAPTSRHSAPGKSGALPRSLNFSLGARTHARTNTHAAFFSDLPAPLHSTGVNLFHASASKAARIPQRRGREAGAGEPPSGARVQAGQSSRRKSVLPAHKKSFHQSQAARTEFQLPLDFQNKSHHLARRDGCFNDDSAGCCFFSLFIGEITCFMQLIYPIF